jgi:molybdate/tungstate transport system permease protein
MEHSKSGKTQRILPLLLVCLHLLINVILGISGKIQPFELFNLLLLSANVVIGILLYRGKGHLIIGTGVMILIATHGMIGHKISPDSLTSGALLMINILAFYSGYKIFDTLPRSYILAFVGSYGLLFVIFMMVLENAQSLFLLALFGLCGVARNFRLLLYFWAIVLSFTLCQPYAWQTALILFFFLKILFSLNFKTASLTAILFLACGFLFIFFVLFPVIMLLMQEDPRNIVNTLKDPSIRDALYLTGVTATISTIVISLFCIPCAYAISRLKFFAKPLLLSLIDLPIVIPQSAAGIALLQIFGRRQYVGEALFSAFGIQFDGTVLGICLAQIFVAMPYMTKSALAAFQSVPAGLESSAQILGASAFSAFRRVAFPLSAKGLFIGSILSWARAAGEFGAVLFIASSPVTAPIAVYNRFISVGIVQVAPLVTTLLFFSLAMFFLLQFCSRMIPSLFEKETA